MYKLSHEVYIQRVRQTCILSVEITSGHMFYQFGFICSPFVINGRHSNFNALAHCVDNLLGYNSRILEVNLDALTGPYVCISTDCKYFLFADCELLDL